MKHTFIIDKIKLGKKGQITIPKSIRDEDGLKENDLFIITHMLDGDIIIHKKEEKTPEDLILDAINNAPQFDWRNAWKEIEEERNRERS